MKNLTSPFLAAAIAMGGLAAHGETGWPQFHGPAGAGVADQLNPPLRFGPDSNLLWKTETSGGLSSPILSGGLIFLTGCDGSRLETICVDLSSGKIRWRQAIDAPVLEKVHKVNSDATPTPVCDGERVYSYFGSFGLAAYNFDGSEAWRKPLPMPKTFMDQGTSTSPVRVGDAVVVFEQNGNDSALMAFGAKDGRELWKAPCPIYNITWATPVCWNESGEDRVGLACAGRFSAFDSRTGNLVWWTDGLSKQICSTPACSDGTLFISSASVQGERSNMKLPPTFGEFAKKYDRNGDGLISFDEVPPDFIFTDRQASGGAGNMTLRQAMTFFTGIDQSKPMNKEAWDQMRDALKHFIDSAWNNSNIMAVRAGGKGDVTASNRVWQQTRGIPEIASAVIYGKRIYQVRSGGLLACRDQATGNLIYEERLAAQGGYFASPIAADGRIYTVSDRGVVTVIKSGDTFTELASADLGESVKATPALARNTIIIRSSGHLWAFGERAGK
ncbi:MAG TPA: PQQ-binding-like beta-propeller repeat protein [Verrucomicrobiae bacterium]